MKKILYTVSILFLMSSCSGFLEEIPKDKLTTENYYKTEDQAESATNSIYAYLTTGNPADGLFSGNFGGVFYNNYWVLQDVFSDNAENKKSSAEAQSISDMQIDAYNSSVKVLWRNFYQTIKACNIVLDKVPSIEMDTIKKNNFLAEAHFFRAMMYFDLVRMFGDVPLHTSNIDNPDDANIPRNPKSEVYQLIINDLEYAEAGLMYAPRLGSGMPYSLSASALLARVYLTIGTQNKNNEDLAKSIEYAKKALANFPLETYYGDLFTIPNRFNPEIIWAANFNKTIGGGLGGGQFLVSLLPSGLDKNLGGPDNAQGWENATDDLAKAYTNNDLRKQVTLRNTFNYNDGTTADLGEYYFFKYWDQVNEPNGNNTDTEFPAIRGAEMYLIIAEASNEINNAPNTEASDALQAVRRRAGVDSQTIPTDYAGFKSAVLRERRLEFAMEGHRWFDLVRMCTPNEFVSIIKSAKPTSTPNDYNILFPIPQEEINLSNGVLTQNPGYSTK